MDLALFMSATSLAILVSILVMGVFLSVKMYFLLKRSCKEDGS